MTTRFSDADIRKRPPFQPRPDDASYNRRRHPATSTRCTMKAVELRNGFGIENVQIVDRPEPSAGPGQVLVRMKAFSLNYRDLLMVKGQYNPRLKLPITILSDGA